MNKSKGVYLLEPISAIAVGVLLVECLVWRLFIAPFSTQEENIKRFTKTQKDNSFITAT